MAEKIPVSFKDTEIENKLLSWIKKKSAILGVSGYIKQVLYEKMIEEENNNNSKPT